MYNIYESGLQNRLLKGVYTEMKNRLLTIGICGVLGLSVLSVLSTNAFAKSVTASDSSTNIIEQAIVKKQNNHVIYDGNKVKFTKDNNDKEDKTTIFSDDFSKGIDQDTWYVDGNASVVKDTMLNQNVLKIQSNSSVTSKNFAMEAKSPGFYRLTVMYKSDSTDVIPTIGFTDGGLSTGVSLSSRSDWRTQSYVFSTFSDKVFNIYLNVYNQTNDDGYAYMTNVKLEKISPTEQTNFSDGNLDGWTLGNDVTSKFVADSSKGQVVQLGYNKEFPVFTSNPSIPLIYKTDRFDAITDTQASGMVMIAEVSADIGENSEISTNFGIDMTGIVGISSRPDSLDDYTVLSSTPWGYNGTSTTQNFSYGLSGFKHTDDGIEHLNNKINVSKIDVYKGTIILDK